MQQSTMTADRRVEWRDVPEPALEGADEALVRPLAVTPCDLDQRSSRRGAAPGPVRARPRVRRRGGRGRRRRRAASAGRPRRRAVPDLLRRVRPLPARADRRLPACRRARCTASASFGGDWGGALAELVRVPFADAMLVALPAGIAPVRAASASDNLPDGWRTVGPHLDELPGADVLIVGGGGRSIALYAVDDRARARRRPRRLRRHRSRPARARGRARRRDRRRAAERAPARSRSRSTPAAAQAGLACALRSIEPGGVCTSVGIYFEAHDAAAAARDVHDGRASTPAG